MLNVEIKKKSPRDRYLTKQKENKTKKYNKILK
jgi:hypothetical protein